MAASQLYQMLIVNSTWNTKVIRSRGATAMYAAAASGDTPQQLGLRPETRLLGTEGRQFSQQFQLDAAMWYGAISTGPYSDVIRKLFHMFYYAGVIYASGDNGWSDWTNNYFGNVAALLSHGQRVLVQIPATQHGGGELWDWLNSVNKIPTRSAATHGISVLSTPTDLIRGHRKYLDEKGGTFSGKWQSLKGWALGRHFAFNPALGGDGNRNPFSASNDDNKQLFPPIRANGLNGHVYVHYLPPGNSAVGGLLVGCENAEHGKGKNPHTKAGHGLGGSQKVSASGGKKWSELKCGPRKEYNGLICDLTDRGANLDWLFDKPLFDADRLDNRTLRLPTIPRA